ncbi:MAG TPA: nucleoside hydrolase [Steroidobacteraceae bacterium]|nr:nucleoside hydrolase [Steroidobacteraceae bacterium]
MGSSICSTRSTLAQSRSVEYGITAHMMHQNSPLTGPQPLASARSLASPRSMLLALLGVVLVCCASATSAADARRKVIIDQDAFGPAGSNMQAILLLLQAKDVEVLGITIPTGDGWRDEEVSQTLRLLEIAKRTEIPVYPGAVFPLVNTRERVKRWEALYGKLFYNGAWTEKWPEEGAVRRAPFHADPYFVPLSAAGTPKLQAAHETAAAFLLRKVHEFPGEVTIIACGPMTDIALAARLDPQFAPLAKELVFMGGSFNPTSSGNEFAAEYANTPRREFNMRWDPEASSIVLHEPWKKITQVPIDPTTRTYFKPEFIKEVARGEAPFAAYLGEFGQSFPMWDELAVAVWLDPSLVTRSTTLFEDANTVFGPNYGDTLSWAPNEAPGLGERPVNVVFDVDVPRFERMAIDLLTAPH